jgi:outer membrane protein assembly factor BamB
MWFPVCGLILAAISTASAGRFTGFCHAVDMREGKVTRTRELKQGGGLVISAKKQYDLANGVLLTRSWPQGEDPWTFSPKPEKIDRFFVTDGCILCEAGSKLYVLDESSGAMTCEAAIPDMFGLWDTSIREDENRGFVCFVSYTTNSVRVMAVSLKTGNTLWSTEYDSLPVHIYEFTEPRPCMPYCLTGRIMRFWTSPTLWIIDPKTGRKQHDVSFPGDRRNWLTWFLCDENTLVTAIRTFRPDDEKDCGRDIVRGIDIESGKLLWQEDTNTQTHSACAVDGKRITVVDGKTLRLLKNRTGKDEWAITIEGWAISMHSDQKGVHYLKTDKCLYKVDTERGDIYWKAATSSNGDLALGPSGLFDSRVLMSDRGKDRTAQIYLRKLNRDTATVENEIEIQKYAGNFDKISVTIRVVDEQLVNVFVSFITLE